MLICSTRKSKNQKNGPSGEPGPASAGPWRAKRGTLPKLSTFLSQLKGDPLEEKQIFEKKVSQCRKTERRDPLGFLNTQCVVKYQRNWRGDPLKRKKFKKFRKKVSMPKNWKGGPLGVFQHPFCRKTSKNWRENIHFRKKNLSAEKKLKGGPFGLVRYGMLRGKTGKTFLVQFAKPNGAIWCNNIL